MGLFKKNRTEKILDGLYNVEKVTGQAVAITGLMDVVILAAAEESERQNQRVREIDREIEDLNRERNRINPRSYHRYPQDSSRRKCDRIEKLLMSEGFRHVVVLNVSTTLVITASYVPPMTELSFRLIALKIAIEWYNGEVNINDEFKFKCSQGSAFDLEEARLSSKVWRRL